MNFKKKCPHKNGCFWGWGQKLIRRFKFCWEKLRLAIFFLKILKWFLRNLKHGLAYQNASLGFKVFIFLKTIWDLSILCKFKSSKNSTKVIFWPLKTKNIVFFFWFSTSNLPNSKNFIKKKFIFDFWHKNFVKKGYFQFSKDILKN